MINETLLLESLHNFFSVPYNRDKLVFILSNDKKISLRSIDWFITNYSKKNNIYYLIYNDINGNPTFQENNEYKNNMNVFHSYKSQLKAYSKKQFDPFCRKNRIDFRYGPKQDIKKAFEIKVVFQAMNHCMSLFKAKPYSTQQNACFEQNIKLSSYKKGTKV